MLTQEEIKQNTIDYIERLLRQYPHMLDEIQKLNDELRKTLEVKNDTQNTLKAAKINDMPGSGNVSDITYDAVERSIDRHDEHIKYLVSQITIIYADRKSIREAIKGLTMDEYKAVDLHYFKGYRFNRVGGIMHYSKSRAAELALSGRNKVVDDFEKRTKADESGQNSYLQVL